MISRFIKDAAAKVAVGQIAKQDSLDVPFSLWKLAEHHVYCHSYSYFEGYLLTREPFVPFSVELKRQSRSNMPDHWEVDRGAAAILDEDGVLCGTVSSERMEKYGFRFDRTYRAFVLPPCRDHRRGFTITDRYAICVVFDGSYV